MTASRGPQNILEGYARTVARGGGGRTMRANIDAMNALVAAGLAGDGNTVDGTSRTGGQPFDVVVARFPHEPLSAWEIPSPQLSIVTDALTVSGRANFNGGLNINYATVYTGELPTLTKTAFNIAQTASGFGSGSAASNKISFNAININSDTLDADGPDAIQSSFTGEIDGVTLTVLTPVISSVVAASFNASISGTVMTVSGAITGRISAGLTINWSGGTATIANGFNPTYNLESDAGTVTLRAMTGTGIVPGALLAWYPDLADPQTATINGYTGSNTWALALDQGVVASQPMATIKGWVPIQGIGLAINQFVGGTGFGGSRTGVRIGLQLFNGPSLRHANYVALSPQVTNSFKSGGIDVWSGAAGVAWGIGASAYLAKRPVTPLGTDGPVNYRGIAGMEIDYGIDAGAPDDPAYPKASAASLIGLTIARYNTNQCAPAIWEGDAGLQIVQQAPSRIKDLSGNIVPVKAAKFGLIFSTDTLDPINGRAIGVRMARKAYDTDGTEDTEVAASRHGVDWYNWDLTRTQFRGQGFSVLGSDSPYTAGAVQVGGGYLSATSTTVSLDTAGSVCTGATIASGGAVLYPGLALVHDDTGTIVIVSTVDNAVRLGFGAATAVVLLANTGRAHASQIPANPVQFRATGNPLTYPAPGPTGATLNLTWTAPVALALQPSGGAITSGLLVDAVNDAAAATAGVAVGQWYRNGSAMMQRVA